MLLSIFVRIGLSAKSAFLARDIVVLEEPMASFMSTALTSLAFPFYFPFTAVRSLAIIVLGICTPSRALIAWSQSSSVVCCALSGTSAQGGSPWHDLLLSLSSQ